MYSFVFRNCPYGAHEIMPLMTSLSAECASPRQGHLVATFSSSLAGGEVSERVRMLKEYFRSIRREDHVLRLAIDHDDSAPTASFAGVTMEPFGAFGSGLHPTTRGCLALLRECIPGAGDPLSLRMLDLGTGTGILALFAHTLGLRTIIAIDSSPRAVIAAFHNFSRHGVVADIRLRLASVDKVSGPFEVITANLRTHILTGAFASLVEKTASNGMLILSGIRNDEEARIATLIARNGLCIAHRVCDAGWVSLLLRRGEGC